MKNDFETIKDLLNKIANEKVEPQLYNKKKPQKSQLKINSKKSLNLNAIIRVSIGSPS
jgi:hypothetical protein